jgi:hypothetical protein
MGVTTQRPHHASRAAPPAPARSLLHEQHDDVAGNEPSATGDQDGPVVLGGGRHGEGNLQWPAAKKWRLFSRDCGGLTVGRGSAGVPSTQETGARLFLRSGRDYHTAEGTAGVLPFCEAAGRRAPPYLARLGSAHARGPPQPPPRRRAHPPTSPSPLPRESPAARAGRARWPPPQPAVFGPALADRLNVTARLPPATVPSTGCRHTARHGAQVSRVWRQDRLDWSDDGDAAARQGPRGGRRRDAPGAHAGRECWTRPSPHAAAPPRPPPWWEQGYAQRGRAAPPPLAGPARTRQRRRAHTSRPPVAPGLPHAVRRWRRRSTPSGPRTSSTAPA